MNIRFLRTMVAIAENPTFVSAGEAIGLSHSAVSVHVKTLEDELQIPLVDRNFRPPVLTDQGMAVVEYARKILELTDQIKMLTDENVVVGSLNIGVVPSAMVNLVPPALGALKKDHPNLKISIKSGLSYELAQQVRSRDLDAAIVTQPQKPFDELQVRTVCDEPLVMIAPKTIQPCTTMELLRNHTFIWFNRRTWAGQQIESILFKNKMNPKAFLEVDSLEAVESMVENGLGIAIVPVRVCSSSLEERFQLFNITEKPIYRRLVMLNMKSNPRIRLSDLLLSELLKLSSEQHPV